MRNGRPALILALATCYAVLALPAPTSASPASPAAMGCGLDWQPGCVAWAEGGESLSGEAVGGSGHSWSQAVAVARDGSLIFVAGRGHDSAYDADTGALRWQAPNGTSGALGNPDIAITPSGMSVISTGSSVYPNPELVASTEVVVTATDPATGRPRWQARHRDLDGASYTATTLAATDERIFVAGGRGRPNQMATFAFDASTGDQLWVAHYDGQDGLSEDAPSIDEAADIVASPDGRHVYVTGTSSSADGNPEWVTIAYDGLTGERRWVERFSGVAGHAAQPRELVLHPDGSLVYVTGWAAMAGPSGTSFDFVTVAYGTPFGRTRWTDGYRSPLAGAVADSDDLGWSVDLSPDGNRLYVAGYSEDFTHRPEEGPAGYRVEARDSRTGAPLWSSPAPFFVPTSDHQGLFGAVKVRTSADGAQVYLAMSARDELSPTPSEASFGLAGFDAGNGEFLWRASYGEPDGIEPSYARDLAVDPDGRRVYVTGQESGSGSALTAAFRV